MSLHGAKFKAAAPGVHPARVRDAQPPLTGCLVLSRTQSAAHVQFNIARTRMLANMIGFSDDYNSPEHTELVNALKEELAYMRSEYFSMLYGGPVRTVLEDVAPVHTTSSLFRSSAVSDLFFRTTRCLRTDPSTCYEEGEETDAHARRCSVPFRIWDKCGQVAVTTCTYALLHTKSFGSNFGLTCRCCCQPQARLGTT